MFLSSIANTFGNSTFGKTINQKAGTAENTPRSLWGADKMVDVGPLGQLQAKVDLSAQRSYVESGYISNVKPRYAEILMQEPDLTIVVKKRMFSSLFDNYKVEYMDEAEKLFLKASKRLFQNKCQIVSIYEKLSKIEKVVQSKGVLDSFMLPILVNGIRVLDALGAGGIVDPKTKFTLDTITKLNYYSQPSDFTTWTIDPTLLSDYGEGTGTFELTVASSIRTGASINWGQGSASITIEDPYKLMAITELDIEHAINDIYNPITQSSNIFQLSDTQLRKIISDQTFQLSQLRQQRNAPNIIFKINDESILYKRVSAFIDIELKEIIFNYNPGFMGVGSTLDLDQASTSAVVDKNGLIFDNERRLFIDIIKNTYILLNLKRAQKNLEDDAMNPADKERIRYVRNKMRLHFQNKNLIQVMDTIHVFMSSKTTIDNKATGIDNSKVDGSSGNILNLLNSSVSNLQQSFNNLAALFGGSQSNSSVEVEKAALVGEEFPTWLWVMMRNNFTRQAAGCHVWAGIVMSADCTYSNGKYVLSIVAKDHTEYFNLSEINKKPSVDVFDRDLYDPLTPFNLEFDESNGLIVGGLPTLLDENRRLLQSGAAKFDNGSRFLGSQATPLSYFINDGEISNGGSQTFQKVLFDPKGFIYRWKEGIGTYTFNGPKHPSSFIRQRTSPNLLANPFGGQDVMNVLSILITGNPYNYTSFLRSAVNSGNLTRDDLLNRPGSLSYFKSLLSDIQIANTVWGNFIPFKKMSVSEKSYNYIINEFSVQNANSVLDGYLSQRAKYFDSLVVADSSYAKNPQINGMDANSNATAPQNTGDAEKISKAASNIKQLDLAIKTQKQSVFNKLSDSNINGGVLQIFGNDVSFDPTVSGIGGTTTDSDNRKQRSDFRRNIKSLTQRRLWKVKANDDSNLFIVDDQYDKSYDIQWFERKLAGKMELLKSEYASPKDNITAVAGLLGLEVFADTQGHIQARPPAYNRIPSSVFYRLLADKRRLFPTALEKLFVNQAEGLIDDVEIAEDQIRLRTLSLGITNDSDAQTFLSGTVIAGSSNYYFVFLSDPNTGRMGSKAQSLKSLIQQSIPDNSETMETKSLAVNARNVSSINNFADKITAQARKTGLFDTIVQSNTLYNSSLLTINKSSSATSTIMENIRQRLAMKTGSPAPQDKDLFSNNRASIGARSQTDILKITKDIAAFVAERQVLIKQLSGILKNVTDAITINTDPEALKSTLFPKLNSKQQVPEILEHMIEDEDFDDIGEGSGARYVIKENQIISLTIKETPPKYTAIEVNGRYGEGWVTPPSQMSFNQGGNAIVSAYAVDYDLWRMYGFKTGNAVEVPFISDPEGQAAPMAVWLLNQQRRNIIKANCTIVGNEYMQPGEVVYIEDRDLLFYIEDVSHNFDFGGTFTTNMTLTYGHNPGEYIPTMLDMIGRGLYSKNQSNLIRHFRYGNAQGDQNLGAIVVDNSFGPDNNSMFSLIGGKYGDSNKKIMTNMLLSLCATQSLAKKDNQFQKPTVELRYYYNTKKAQYPSGLLEEAGLSIIEWAKNPQQIDKNDPNKLNPDFSTNNGQGLDDSVNIKIIPIDITDPQSPSAEAWQKARDMASQFLNNNINNSNIIQEEAALYNSIIDIWVTINNEPVTNSTSRNPPTTDQSSQDNATALNAAK